MKESKFIERLKSESLSKLKKRAIKEFNAYIRKRDEGKPCISCGNFRLLEAGHYYNAGKIQSLRFNEYNVNGQCKQCNYFMRGNESGYAVGIKERYGKEALDELDLKAGIEKQNGYHKYDRFTLIDIIIRYKKKQEDLCT